MRFALLPFLLCGAFAPSAFATDLYQNFIILEASNLSPVGGTFLQGGTFSGTFTVDVSDVPTVVEGAIALPEVDVSITAGNGAPAATYTSGEIVFAADLSGGINVVAPPAEYEIFFVNGDGSLALDFVEALGTFEGGEVIFADTIQSNSSDLPADRGDFSGDAVAIDPAFITPEPGSIGMGGAGLAMLGAVGWIQRRRVWAGKSN